MGAEIPDGAVLIARAIVDSSLWTMRPEDCKVAITCIAKANWKPKKWFDGKAATVIERGQFITSLDHLATACKLSVRNVRTSLSNLERSGFLTRKVTHRWTLINLCNYGRYQNLDNYYDKPLTQSRHATDTPLTSNRHAGDNKQEGEEGEEGKEREEGNQGPRGSIRFLAKKWNSGPGVHLNGDKACEQIQAAVDVGVDPQVIDQRFTDHHAIRGKKIWEVLDPLRPPNGEAMPTMDEILKNWASKEAKKERHG